MHQQVKDKLHYYLKFGLILASKSGNTYNMGPLTWDCIVNNNFSSLRPLMRPLSSLTNPITVPGYNDGKPFVPMEELAKINKMKVVEYNIIKQNIDSKVWVLFENIRFVVAETLFRWHFWLWDQSLFATGDIIEIKE